MKKNNNIAKILILGESQVGKSSILNRISDKNFVEYLPPTLGIDYKLVNINLENNKNLTLQIWDTAGQERFKSITENFFRNTHGILLVFDLTSKNSFKKINNWMKTIKEKGENPTVVLIGNKNDLKQKYLEENKNLENIVHQEDIELFISENNNDIKYFETSAKEDENITEAFQTLGKSISLKIVTTEPIKLETNKEKVNKGCCN